VITLSLVGSIGDARSARNILSLDFPRAKTELWLSFYRCSNSQSKVGVMLPLFLFTKASKRQFVGVLSLKAK